MDLAPIPAAGAADNAGMDDMTTAGPAEPRSLASSTEAHLISISRLQHVDGVDVSHLRLRGVVRAPTTEEFRSRLSEAGTRSPYLVVDLSELGYITSTGLSLLLMQAEAQRRRKGWLRVVSPSSAVAMILDLSGVGETLAPMGSAEEAVSDLRMRAA
jgi:anti-anti-sigma factor